MPDDDELILKKISIAAHNYGRSKTKHLTSLLSRAEQEIPGSGGAEFSSFTPSDQKAAYRSRLFSRKVEEFINAPPFAKDYARIVHSPSFRKLQGKSQLIPAGESEIFRTRLTHSIEVAEIASRIARSLNQQLRGVYSIDPDLVACSCLLHDIGHPPFGHTGEDKLNELMEGAGGFESNAQTLRLVTQLENRLGRGGEVQAVYDNPRGLNLTVGVLASILKYDKLSIGPIKEGDGFRVAKGYYPEEESIVHELRRRLQVPEGIPLSTIECQVMDVADDIAYSAYDLEDTMEAGIVVPFDFVSVYDESLSKITKDVNEQMRKHAAAGRVAHSEVVSEELVLRHLAKIFATILMNANDKNPYDLTDPIERMVFVARSYNESILHARNQLIRRQFLETLIEMNIRGISIAVNEEQPFLSKLTVDPKHLLTIECMKAYNFHRVIASRRLQIPQHGGKEIIGFLFKALDKDTDGVLLSELHRLHLRPGQHQTGSRKRLIADIISSLTDLEAVKLFQRLRSGGSFFSYL
jgi:dGTPase